MTNEYDDPYIMLAHHLIAYCTTMELARTLVDDEFLKRMLVKEVRNQDFCGPFLDCIVEEILVDKRRMEFMHELDKLSDYFFENLDLERLRKNILKYGTRYGIIEPIDE